MTSYTGTVKTVRPPQGAVFPMKNEWMQMNPRSFSVPKITGAIRVRAFQLKGTAGTAIATNDYTYTLWTAREAEVILACYIVDPLGQAVDATNYNTFVLLKDAVTMCSRTDAYGIAQFWPWEVSRANTRANRLLAATNVVTLTITGTVLGKAISDGLWVFVVTERAAA